jgi:hypothetical protein
LIKIKRALESRERKEQKKLTVNSKNKNRRRMLSGKMMIKIFKQNNKDSKKKNKNDLRNFKEGKKTKIYMIKI